MNKLNFPILVIVCNYTKSQLKVFFNNAFKDCKTDVLFSFLNLSVLCVGGWSLGQLSGGHGAHQRQVLPLW